LILAPTVNNVGEMEKNALDIKTMVPLIASPPSIVEIGLPLVQSPLKPIFETLLNDKKFYLFHLIK
jgi:hypothetical protein